MIWIHPALLRLTAVPNATSMSVAKKAREMARVLQIVFISLLHFTYVYICLYVSSHEKSKRKSSHEIHTPTHAELFTYTDTFADANHIHMHPNHAHKHTLTIT